jgi:colanic acid/amylovoran biosynthesis protein
MIIEIKGAGFTNKGAELMLHATLQKTKEAFSEASFVMAPKTGDDFSLRAALGLWQKIWLQRYGVQWGSLGRVIPQKLRRFYGLVIDEEIDVILDASGFAYSDQWGEKPTIAMASYVKTWKNRGVKIILLPQAMGPFTSPGIRKAFSYISKNADLVFPRDDISYKHVTELVGERDNIFQAPDFTNLVSGLLPQEPERFRGRYCLVPNYRMMEKTSENIKDQYPNFCANCIKVFVKFGHTPFILIHEGEKDILLAENIRDRTGINIEIVREIDALKIKGILGLCAGVISSRFHGVVSALTQGVPALATGWSHKYEMLFQEYGFPEGCLPVTIDVSDLNKKIERIINDGSRKEILETINSAREKLLIQSEEMWKKVFTVIEN